MDEKMMAGTLILELMTWLVPDSTTSTPTNSGQLPLSPVAVRATTNAETPAMEIDITDNIPKNRSKRILVACHIELIRFRSISEICPPPSINIVDKISMLPDENA